MRRFLITQHPPGEDARVFTIDAQEMHRHSNHDYKFSINGKTIAHYTNIIGCKDTGPPPRNSGGKYY